MNAVRSFIFAVIFYPMTALAVLAAFPMALFGPGPLLAVVKGWVRVHHWCARHVLGIETVVQGEMARGAVIVASKHQSMFETLELARLLEEPAIVVKQELAAIPGWGWAARRYGVIPVDRAGGAATLRLMITAGREALAAGRAILIFPEGTRVAPGEQPPLQPGFAGIYRALGVAVVPVALDSGLLWPRQSFTKRPGTVTFRFGAPIAPGLSRKDIESRIHTAINALEINPAAGHRS